MTASRSLPDLSALAAEMPLEFLLCDPSAFGLTTASSLQRAICRIADGRKLGALASDPTVVAALGGPLAISELATMRVRPREVAILSGIRVGKSLIAAALAVAWALRCDVSKLGPGEVPRVSIVSLTKDLADVVFSHVVGRLQQSPLLAGLVLGEPSADCILVRHPTGRTIEIQVVAGSRAGASLVARWSAGCIFDEFPRMVDGAEGVVNWTDSRNGVVLRLLKGSQLVHIGSPWAPDGPAFDLVEDRLGKPGADMVVIKAPAPAMNPWYWTPEVIAEAKLKPNAYRTDVLAEFSAPEERLFDPDLLGRAMRPECGPELGQTYSAAMDPAMRGNGWTFGLFTRTDKRKRMVVAREVVGSREQPLSPREVFRDVIAPLCNQYEVRSIDTDQHHVDSLQDIAREFGLSLVQTPLSEREKVERYAAIKTKLEEGEIELPQDVRSDLQRLQKRVTQNGVQIVLPATSDGRHCDFAPTVMLGIGRYLRDVAPPKKKEDPETVKMLAAATKRYGRGRSGW